MFSSKTQLKSKVVTQEKNCNFTLCSYLEDQILGFQFKQQLKGSYLEELGSNPIEGTFSLIFHFEVLLVLNPVRSIF